jgi:hypothetical protein
LQRAAAGRWFGGPALPLRKRDRTVAPFATAGDGCTQGSGSQLVLDRFTGSIQPARGAHTTQREGRRSGSARRGGSTLFQKPTTIHPAGPGLLTRPSVDNVGSHESGVGLWWSVACGGKKPAVENAAGGWCFPIDSPTRNTLIAPQLEVKSKTYRVGQGQNRHGGNEHASHCVCELVSFGRVAKRIAGWSCKQIYVNVF